MGSPPGGIGPRSATNHAGEAARVTKTFSWAADAAGATIIVADPEDGRKIKVLDYMLSIGAKDKQAELASSGVALVEGTSITGLIKCLEVGIPFTQKGDPIVGIGECAAGENLVVSGDSVGAGNVVYSLVP
jgi:hypothetical protein